MKDMKRALQVIVIVVLAAEALVIGQGGDVAKVLAEVRAALGGDAKLAAVKTLAVTGRSTRVTGESSAPATDFEFAFELPARFMKKDVLAVMSGMSIARTTGFNGETPIEVVDMPPQMPGRVMVRSAPAGGVMLPPGVEPTTEQEAAMKKAALASARQEFARLTLGMFATSFASFPLEFKYGARAESPDGAADVIDVTGAEGFAAKLFVDGRTRLPLMLTWMAREPAQPMTINRGAGTPGAVVAGGAGHVMMGGGAHVQSGGQLTPEERERLIRETTERMQQAEANRRLVEYRLYYSDYRAVDGVKLPFRIQRAIDGKPTEELAFESVKVNAKIDAKKFEPK
jgi:hypothetical protein